MDWAFTSHSHVPWHSFQWQFSGSRATWKSRWHLHWTRTKLSMSGCSHKQKGQRSPPARRGKGSVAVREGTETSEGPRKDAHNDSAVWVKTEPACKTRFRQRYQQGRVFDVPHVFWAQQSSQWPPGVGVVRKMRSELGGLRLCRAVPGLQLSELENRS